MTLEIFIINYGYFAILIGTFFEGEAILILAGFLAHRGYLELSEVILAAFLGAIAGDNFCFWLGRLRGAPILAKRPAWQRKAARVRKILEGHSRFFVVIIRFLYGLRTITPIVIGASGMPPLQFLALEGVGAVLWSITIGILGYLLGETLHLALGKVQHYEATILLVVIAAGMLVWLARRIRMRRLRSDRLPG